jgi:hypothetical protein
MKQTIPFIGVLLVAAVLFSACELVTQDPPLPVLRPANHLVINEVFTLPVNHQRAFSWIEFYNPTHQVVNTEGWTFSFSTSGLLITIAFDSSGQQILTSYREYLLPQGVYEIPLPVYDLNPGEFFTATNNEERLLTYTDYGPGKGPKLAGGSNVPYRIDTVKTSSQAVPDTLYIYQAIFHLQSTDQLVLKDSSGAVIDVVRYGNYAYSGPGADPYSSNRSIGLLPEFQSIARYGGAYFTGNTAEDFYVTQIGEPLTRPIPHWLSQAFKH